jgi:hypothetical protein
MSLHISASYSGCHGFESLPRDTRIPSFSPGKCWDGNLIWSMKAAFRVLSNSSSTLVWFELRNLCSWKRVVKYIKNAVLRQLLNSRNRHIGASDSYSGGPGFDFRLSWQDNHSPFRQVLKLYPKTDHGQSLPIRLHHYSLSPSYSTVYSIVADTESLNRLIINYRAGLRAG